MAAMEAVDILYVVVAFVTNQTSWLNLGVKSLIFSSIVKNFLGLSQYNSHKLKGTVKDLSAVIIHSVYPGSKEILTGMTPR